MAIQPAGNITSTPAAIKKPELKPAETDAKNITIPLAGADDNPAPSLGLPKVGDSFGTFEQKEQEAASISDSSEKVKVESATEKEKDGSPKVYETTVYTRGKGEQSEIVAAKRINGTSGSIAIGKTVYTASDVKKGNITHIKGDGYEIIDRNDNGIVDDGELKVSRANMLLGKRYGTVSEVKKLLDGNKDKRLEKYSWSLDPKDKNKINTVQINPLTIATDTNGNGIVDKNELSMSPLELHIGSDPTKNPLEQLIN